MWMMKREKLIIAFGGSALLLLGLKKINVVPVAIVIRNCDIIMIEQLQIVGIFLLTALSIIAIIELIT
jgi:hypothetical protein